MPTPIGFGQTTTTPTAGTTQNYHFFGRRPLATVFWNLFEIENKKRVLKVEIDCV